MKRLFSSFRMALVTSGLAVLLFASCRKSDSNYTSSPVAGLMAFNLVSDKSLGVSIALGDNSFTPGALPYAGYTGRYISIYPGAFSVQSYEGITFTNPLTSTNNTFIATRFYSIFVTGANGVYSNVVTEDNYDSLSSTTGQAYVRYINAIPDSSDPRVTITAPGGTVVSNNNAHYGTVSRFTQVAPGSVTINLSNDGNIQSNRTITLEGQKAYTILLTGIPGSAETDKAVQIKYIENGRLTE